MNILYLEDDGAQAMIVSDFLQRTGHTVTHVKDLDAAKRYLPEDFDLLLADNLLPDGTGLDLAKLWTGRIKIIFLSAETDPKYTIEFQMLGMYQQKAGIGYDTPQMMGDLEKLLSAVQWYMEKQINIVANDSSTVNVEVNE